MRGRSFGCAQDRSGAQQELLYGRQGVREALRAGRRHPQRLYLAQGVRPNPTIDEILERAQRARVVVETVDRQRFGEWLGDTNHQGLALRASAFAYAGLDEVLDLARSRSQPPLFLLLDRVQDPQNLGTLLRTAEACGVHGVVLPRHRAASITPAVVNASAGAVEHLLVCQETNLAATLKQLQAAGLWIAGLQAQAEAQPFDSVDLSGPLGIVVGSEGSGLSRLVSETCDWLLHLPMVGRIDSLNAAVAGSLLLYHVMRLRLETTRSS